MTPRLSVVMAARDADAWVGAAVDSILAQTHRDFEFIVIDDGSADRTGAILDAYRDPRLKAIHRPQAGLTGSLNHAFRLTRAPLVARMDADDLATPERFARQLEFLETHPEVGLLGTGCHEVSPTGEILRTVTPPVDDGAIRRALIRANPFVHSSVVVRREALEAAGFYDERLPVAQDYDLWFRMSQVTRMANLREPLVLRRLTPGRVSSARDTARLWAEVRVKLRAVRSGAYPPWCAVFLAKPLFALALPPAVRRLVRVQVARWRSRRASVQPG